MTTPERGSGSSGVVVTPSASAAHRSIIHRRRQAWEEIERRQAYELGIDTDPTSFGLRSDSGDDEGIAIHQSEGENELLSSDSSTVTFDTIVAPSNVSMLSTIDINLNSANSSATAINESISDKNLNRNDMPNAWASRLSGVSHPNVNSTFVPRALSERHVDTLSAGLKDMAFVGNPGAIRLPPGGCLQPSNYVGLLEEMYANQNVTDGLDCIWPLMGSTNDGMVNLDMDNSNSINAADQFEITSEHHNAASWSSAVHRKQNTSHYAQYENRESVSVSPRDPKNVNSARPFPHFDVTVRMHDTNIFGQDQNGELLSCFVWCSGQGHERFIKYGIFESYTDSTKYPSFVSIGFGDADSFVPQIFLYYRDIREAQEVRDGLNELGNAPNNRYGRLRTVAKCISMRQLCQSLSHVEPRPEPKDFPTTFVYGYDGQIVIQATPISEDDRTDSAWYGRLYVAVREFLRGFGPFKVMLKINNQYDARTRYAMWHVEFYDHTMADGFNDFLKEYPHGYKYQGCLVWGMHYHPMIANPPSRVGSIFADEIRDPLMALRRRWVGVGNPIIENLDSYTPELVAEEHRMLTGFDWDPRGPDGGRMHYPLTVEDYCQEDMDQQAVEDAHYSHFNLQRQDDAAYFHQHMQDQIGYTAVPVFGSDDLFFADASTPSPRGQRGRGVRSIFQRETKNVVNLDRIRAGLDCRTTIMLRNIPNRVNADMLKLILDATSRGKFDFSYLRIDFQNNCNVGYAFINFQLAMDIVQLVDSIAGKRWFNSDKIAEVSYATMQGRECLIQKFRNSSVMQEHPTARPKLWYCYPDPRAGQEEAFPRADNLLKLARSNQNAAHIGLFSPGRGGQGHPGSTRRIGAFDRGTPSAEAEELRYGSWLPREGASPEEVEEVAATNPGKLHPLYFGTMTANGFHSHLPSPRGSQSSQSPQSPYSPHSSYSPQSPYGPQTPGGYHSESSSGSQYLRRATGFVQDLSPMRRRTRG